MEPFRITRRDVEELSSSLRESREYLKSHAKGGQAKVPRGVFTQLMGSGETAAGAFVAGVVYGTFGDVLDKSPIPLDFAAWAVGQTVAYLEVFGDWSPHIARVADGPLAFFAGRTGVGIGTKLRAQQNPPRAPVAIAGEAPSEMLPMPRPLPLTEAELRARAQRVRAHAPNLEKPTP